MLTRDLTGPVDAARIESAKIAESFVVEVRVERRAGKGHEEGEGNCESLARSAKGKRVNALRAMLPTLSRPRALQHPADPAIS